MDRQTRLSRALVVVTAVLGLVTGVVAVVVAAPGRDRVETPAAARSRAEEPAAVRVLRAWDARRSRAYAHGDARALAALYVAGSRTGAADRAVLLGYLERGLRVTRMHTQVLEARPLHSSSRRLVLLVTDVLLDAVATGPGDGGWALPRDRPSTRRVVFVRRGKTWLVDEAYAVG